MPVSLPDPLRIHTRELEASGGNHIALSTAVQESGRHPLT